MKAIILAAGYATRLYPLTLHTPKALLPIHQKPIINYIVEQMETIQALDAIYVVSNHKFYDQFEAWAKALCCKKPITVLDDGTTSEENRRGAIGDILFTIETMQLDDELMVVAGDNLFTFSLQAYVDFFHQMGKDCVCVKPIGDYEALKSFGVAQLDETGKLIGLEEKPKEPKSNLAVFATYMYRQDTLPLFSRYIAEGNKPDAPGYFVEWLYRHKDVYAFTFEEECYDIGTEKSLREVSALFEARELQKK